MERSNAQIVVIFLIPIITFLLYAYNNSVNVPYGDDSALFLTINHLDQSYHTIFSTLFSQHNEHRVVFSRLAMLFVYTLTGSMNFKIVILLGLLNIALLSFVLYLFFKQIATSIYYFLPVVLILFSPIVSTNQLWALTSFEHSLSICFSLLCLYFTQKDKRAQWWYSWLFATAAPLANLDGLCVLPIALVWLMLQKRWRHSLLFAGFMTLYLSVFFSNFKLVNSLALPPLDELIMLLFKSLLIYTGSIAKVISDSYVIQLSTVLGLLMLLTFGWIIIQRVITQKNNNELLSINVIEISFLHLLACGMMLAIGRAGDEIGAMAADRFQIYAATIACLFYLVVLNRFKEVKIGRTIAYGALVMAVVASAYSYTKYTAKMDHHIRKLVADSFNYQHHAVFLHQFIDVNDPPRVNFRNYTFPPYIPSQEIEQCYQQLQLDTIQSTARQVKVHYLHKAEGFEKSIYPLIQIDINTLPSTLQKEQLYLLFYPSNAASPPYIAAPFVAKTNWLRSMITPKTEQNISLTIANKLPEGNYDLALYWKNEQGVSSLKLTPTTYIAKSLPDSTTTPSHYVHHLPK